MKVDEILTRNGFHICGPFFEKDLDRKLKRICSEYRNPGVPSLDPTLQVNRQVGG